MNRYFFTSAFVLGAMAALWVAFGFLGTNTLALTMTLMIALFYTYGTLELHRYRQASYTLETALTNVPQNLTHLSDWLVTIHPTLQNAVRMRIQGDRIGLPGPAFTPYLLGLLVMLGMLGTFLGMVVTLNGAVFALEGTSDLQAIRSAFATPIKGLGLAFGTSVAGVATSAMLGLMSAISRHERATAAQTLDNKISTEFRHFSLTYQRQETYKALQVQSLALPAVVEQMQSMMEQMDQMNQQLNARLLANQEGFHASVKSIYTDLAHSVDKSLRDSLTHSAQVAGESIRPIVELAMSGIAADSREVHVRLMGATQRQLAGLTEGFQHTADGISEAWTQALTQHKQTNERMLNGLDTSLQGFNSSFEQQSKAQLLSAQQTYTNMQGVQAANDELRLSTWSQSLETIATNLSHEWKDVGAHTLAQQERICGTLTQTAQTMSEQAQDSASQTMSEIARLVVASEELVKARIASETNWTQQHGEHMNQMTASLRLELGALRDVEAQTGSAAVERLGELQTALTAHLSTLGTALEAPITRLIETASEAPRAAAEVIGKLREEVSNGVARDNALLTERGRILETLNGLLASIHHASTEQRGVIDSLVETSAMVLQQTSTQFADLVGAQTDKLSDIAANVTSSAVEVSALGETFSFAVKKFGEANEKLIANLQRIESAMNKSMARSDDQLAYYVAQAREVIDLSVMSQKEIVEELRQLPSRKSAISEVTA
jgi:hypothetical protein